MHPSQNRAQKDHLESGSTRLKMSAIHRRNGVRHMGEMGHVGKMGTGERESILWMSQA